MVQGANLVTVDVLESRVTTERYHNLLQSAAAAHFNILRINGDANYMKDGEHDRLYSSVFCITRLRSHIWMCARVLRHGGRIWGDDP